MPRYLTVTLTRRTMPTVLLPRSWLGRLSLLLLFCIGVGFVSAALPEGSNVAGYYDGDADDAAMAPTRMALLVDMAFGPRVVGLPERISDVFARPVETAAPPIVEQSPPPPLRSPPHV